jgi:transcription antitermination factor NusG
MSTEYTTTDPAIRIWIAVYTAPNAEIAVRDAVQGLGYPVLLPTAMVEMRHARRAMMIDRPVFPRYAFVGLPVGRSWYPLRTVTGVTGVVSRNGEPQALNDKAVRLLRAAIEADAFAKRQTAEFSEGQKVQVTVGSTPVEAFVERVVNTLPAQRVDIMFRLFGKEHRRSVPVDRIRAA